MTGSTTSPNSRGPAAARPFLPAPILAAPILPAPILPAPILAAPILASLLLLGGCFWGGAERSLELTGEERVAEPRPAPGPIQFVWEGEDGTRTALISTTTSTTTPPTESFIARQKIAEHRRRPRHAHRIIPPLNPNAPPTPPRREPAITLVPLDGGLVIRKRAAAQSGDVSIGQETPAAPQRLINNPPSGRLSIGGPAGGRVTVLGVTQEIITPGTTKGP